MCLLKKVAKLTLHHFQICISFHKCKRYALCSLPCTALLPCAPFVPRHTCQRGPFQLFFISPRRFVLRVSSAKLYVSPVHVDLSLQTCVFYGDALWPHKKLKMIGFAVMQPEEVLCVFLQRVLHLDPPEKWRFLFSRSHAAFSFATDIPSGLATDGNRKTTQTPNISLLCGSRVAVGRSDPIRDCDRLWSRDDSSSSWVGVGESVPVLGV